MPSFAIYARLSKIAVLNMVRGWRHSLATVQAVVAGFVAICVFDGYINDTKHTMTDVMETRSMFGQLIIEKPGAQSQSFDSEWHYMLDENEVRQIDDFLMGDEEVASRVRFLRIRGVIHNSGNSPYFIGYGYDVAEGAQVRGDQWAWNVFAGTPLHLEQSGDYIVLGGQMGQSLNCEYPFIGNYTLPEGNYQPAVRPFNCPHQKVVLSVITEFAQVNAAQMTIAGFANGFFDHIDRSLIYMPLDKAQRLYDTKRISMMAVHLKHKGRIEPFIARFNAAMAAKNMTFDIKPTMKHPLASFLAGGMRILMVFRHLFMGVLGVIAILSVYNTMIKSVNERIREIGTFRSLGFFRRHLIYMFTLEGGCLAVAACLIGFLTTIAISVVIDMCYITYDAGIIYSPVPLHIKFSPLTWLLSGIVFIALTMITAYVASRRACDTAIANAMRHVE